MTKDNMAKDKPEFIRITTRKTGETRYYTKSDFLGGCWHIYVANNHDAWIYNIFSEEEFNEEFEPFNREKCDEYIRRIKER